MYGCDEYFDEHFDDKLIGRIYRLRHDPSRMFSVCLSPPPSSKLYLTSDQYKWKMRVLPPQKNDQMLQVIKKTIAELNKQYMLFWRIGLEVSHLTMSPPLWPRHLEEYSTKLYAFKEKDREFPMAVEATLSRGCRRLTAETILVREKDDMNGPKPGMPLKTWLLFLVNSRDSLGEAGWQLQRGWWASNDQDFSIMTLPAEIRCEILRQILGGNIYPVARENPNVSGPVVFLGAKSGNMPVSHWPEVPPASRPDPPNYAILRASKQIYGEGLKAAWEGTTKHFADGLWLEKVLEAPIAPSNYRWLTHIQLSLSTKECFRFFGIDIHPVLRLPPLVPKARLLQGIATLNNLEIVFGSPYVPYSNPWFSFPNRPPTIMKYPCHKIMVEWALIFAFPYLKHIPNVRLAGCIKTCTKSKWEHILSNEYYLRKESFKTHGYDPAMEAYELLEEQRPMHRQV
ncbi:hypothetical protein J4E83_005155 [Alternaria metachromatica]|uniref:uncharacterized protein n=1 Tax=Alternaria metachromatica TaxID=283354 RepID=UPI0020C1C99F|nr:uncharacterized protein J4E83_005155 [Alternaria metachromatica]KAI4620794.1 hypothetical protein J4E83_005155 [Alternaria metachromatica]